MTDALGSAAGSGGARASGLRAIAADNISGVAATGDNAKVDARRIELHRPSTAPDIHSRMNNLPKPPTRLFVGRERELVQLQAVMSAGHGVISQAVHGLGGVGKTELALQYAHRYKERYSVRWWVTAEDLTAIEDGLAGLTARVNAELALVMTAAEAAEWAVGWLQNHSGWLLVLDNVEQRADVEPLLARVDNGHVLITTRRDVDWESIVDGCLRLETLDRASAVRLLIERGEQSDQLTAAVLADELGNLPLALQQAAAYLRQSQLQVASYLDRLRDQPTELLDTIAEGDRAERAVAQVWLVSLERLHRDQPTAIELLRVLSCYASDDVPRGVLVGHGDTPGSIDRSLAVLASYSLVTLTPETVSTHRLVQTVVRGHAQALASRDALAEPNCQQEPSWKQSVGQALSLLHQAVPRGNPADDVETWPRWSVLAPHVEALARHIPEGTRDLIFAQLLGQLGFFFYTQANHQKAVQSERRALEITEAALPAEHLDIALRLDNLAGTLVDLGQAAEALPLRRRALEITEAALPPDDPYIAIRLGNLAYALVDLGQAAEALPLQQRALEINEAALPPGHPELATVLDNLAYTLVDLGQAAEALPLQQRALEISEAALPAGHPDVALRLDNLAHTLSLMGHEAEGLPLRRRALEITEAALPAGHPGIAIRLDNLASTLAALGQAAEALPLQQRALEISEEALPVGHPKLATRLNNLATTLARLGQAREVLSLQQRALKISEAALPASHPDIALRLGNLAYTLVKLGRLEEALTLQQRALKISEAALPASHPDIASRLEGLAYTQNLLGRPEEALTLQQRALKISEAALPASHPDIASRLGGLGIILGRLGRLEEALTLQQQALEISKAAFPAGHPDIATRLSNLAVIQCQLGRLKDALPLQRRALEISEAALPAGHPDIAARLSGLGFILSELGRPEEALQHRALEISEAASPAGEAQGAQQP
ncbi:tetratricopeptide repeat protein [Micromonospora sp. NPDC049175]|uniref:tetratricopeptide repeat protein n=1 Tax=Micromonospora sp. NPDC049175 TaxID=3364266 RepID=UPI00371BF501